MNFEHPKQILENYLKKIDFVDEINIDSDKSNSGENVIRRVTHDSFVYYVYGVCPSDNNVPLESFYDKISEGSYHKLDNSKIIVREGVRNVVTAINYPLSNRTEIEFVCNKDVTFGMLLYLHMMAYNIVYDIEDFDVKEKTKSIGELSSNGLMNRAYSHGRYGIWGHYLSDLVYNGLYNILIKENLIICNFECDS